MKAGSRAVTGGAHHDSRSLSVGGFWILAIRDFGGCGTSQVAIHEESCIRSRGVRSGGHRFSALASAENAEEFGVFFPTTNGANAEYWGAWRLTFGLHPENQNQPQLADYYDEGSPHPLISRLVAAYPSYNERESAFDEKIKSLLTLAGTSLARERLFLVLGALRGGRHNDLATYSKTAIGSNARTINETIFRNSYAIENGPQGFADRYNEGRLPEAVITSPIFPSFPAPASTDS